MSKLISALLISVSLIASQTAFAGISGAPCHEKGKIFKKCNRGTENCICRDTIKDKKTKNLNYWTW